MRRGFSSLLLLVIAAVVVLIGGASYVGLSWPTETTQTSQPVETTVTGMKQFVDRDFGFSFWYPSEWTVTKTADSVQVFPASDPDLYISVTKRNSSTMEGRSLFSTYSYWYDEGSKTWMQKYGEYGDGTCNCQRTSEAKSTETTIGNLPEFAGGAIHGFATVFIPLSPSRVLEVRNGAGASSLADVLAKTVAPLNVSVDARALREAQEAFLADHYYVQSLKK